MFYVFQASAMRKMAQKEPSKRPSASDMLCGPLFLNQEQVLLEAYSISVLLGNLCNLGIFFSWAGKFCQLKMTEIRQVFSTVYIV